MPGKHNETTFEEEAEAKLIAGGWSRLSGEGYDPAVGLWPEVLAAFVQATQPTAWAALEQVHGGKTAAVVVDAFAKAAGGEAGVLRVLRHGFKCYGKRLRAAFFRPATGLNPETQKLYDANRPTVTRQLRYSEKNGNSLDLVLAVNGVPVVTVELKNPVTNQTVKHAMRQYREDRDPAEAIFAFNRGALVHLAVDPDEAQMTTRLAGGATRFLPFNRGNGTAAGNPPVEGGRRTDYLWDEVLTPDSLMDVIGRFLHLEIKEEKDTVTDKTRKKQALIFPRYHQLRAVRKLEAATREDGPGANYLVQHSAGSGKSNSIAWLAHRLASLHDAADRKVFDTVVVMTDRRVLDRQLQDTIYQFEHKHGVVEKIDRDSAQLAAALSGGTPIVITTLQKFPYVADKLGADVMKGKRFAVIVDEAHSGQGGEAAAEAKGVLGAGHIDAEATRQAEADGLNDTEEMVLREVLKRGRQPNVSFFAFTATPKHKTVEVFGSEGPDGKPRPTDLYPMRQAIEEGFILDVLRGYTTYKTFYKLAKTAADDPKLPKRKAAAALARFQSLHPHNLAQKAEVIVEHYRRVVKPRIGGKAKAMLVTDSRLHAVRYKQAIDAYIEKNNLGGQVRTLVGFSGTVDDDGVEHTEAGMNDGIGGDRIPAAFATANYHLLICADKFQTGFDQPLLHTMYVDKRLAGIQAVQTLSRLNRTTPGKDETFVLDFRNDREEILAAFQDYYETAEVVDEADPQQLYELQAQLDAAGVYHDVEVDSYATALFTKSSRPHHAVMNAALDAAVDRFTAMEDEEDREQFRGRLSAFVSLYRFLSQVMPFGDSDLEKRYAFGRALLRKLPREDEPAVDLGDDVALHYYRLQKQAEGDLELQPGETGELPGPTSVGTAKKEQEEAELSSLIDRLNDRFGTEFTKADQLFFDSVAEAAADDASLQQAARANTPENFGLALSKVLQTLMVNRMDQNGAIFDRYMSDPAFRAAVEAHLGEHVYDRLSGDGNAADAR